MKESRNLKQLFLIFKSIIVVKKSVLTFMFLSFFATLLAQTPPDFKKNISLPDQSGGFGFDIITANQKIFVHAQSKILIYNESNNSLDATIDLKTVQQSTGINYGKYSPPYFNYGFHSPSRQTMVLNSDKSLIYTVTPDLNIISIQTSGNYNTTKLIPRPSIINHFHVSSGKVVLKYDGDNNRLYALYSGRNSTNLTGSFHKTDTYFAVYSINQFNGSLNLIGEELNMGTVDYYETINEVEPHRIPGSDLFYICRKGKIELWEITGNPGNPLNKLNNIDQGIEELKFGKMFTAKNADLHKIIVLPYRLPGTGFEPPLTEDVFFYVLDAGDINMEYDAILSPSKRVIDGTFLSGKSILALTFREDDLLLNDPQLSGENVSFYKYNTSLPVPVFEPEYSWKLNTNGYQQNDQVYNYNYPMKIVPGRNDDFYLGCVDQLVHVYFDNVENKYQHSSKINQPGSYFVNGTISPNFNYFTSLTQNGYYKSDDNSYTTIQTGFAVYHSIYNPSNNQLYFYNTLNTSNSSIFVYDPFANNGVGEIEGKLVKTLELGFPIGDIVYNPFQKHLLISSNSSTGIGTIKVLNSYDNFEDDITLSGKTHLKQMFVAPDQNLSILTNSNANNPVIMIYDASDYSYKNQQSLTLTKSVSCYFNADFCYNNYNSTTYATVKNDRVLTNPYATQRNNCKFTPEDGLLISILTDGSVVEIIPDGHTSQILVNPGKIICPEISEPPVNFEGGLYIQTNNNGTFGNNLSYYDCSDNTLVSVNFQPSIFFNDFVFDKNNNNILGFSDQTISTPQPPEYVPVNDRIAKFYRIERNGSSFTKSEIGFYEGQIAAFFHNPYNGLLYVHTKTDINKWGGTPSLLLQYDPNSTGNVFTSEELGVTSYYTEYDHFDDELYSFFNYNLSTPYIDPYLNNIFLPNGAHSVVSVVEVELNETLSVEPGINWISIPRHEGNTGLFKGVPNQGEPYDYDFYPTNLVFHSDNFENGVNQLQLIYNNVELTEPELVYANYNNPFSGWDYDDDMNSTFSYRGYKLITYQASNNELTLKGKIENPNTLIELKKNKETWVGYFIYEEQDVLDAIKDFEHNIYDIKLDDIYCYRGDITHGQDGSQPPTPPIVWHCNQLVHNIKYGDMLVIHADSDIDDFTWNYSGNPPLPRTNEEPEYYEYAKTSDYTPFIIELDSTENPQEMGAFVNDSCIGACTLEPQDSLAIILGYIGNNSGDSVVFEEYFGTKSSAGKRITNYYVFNEKFKTHEKRAINTNENKRRYFVSLKDKKVKSPKTGELTFNIFPNPTTNQVNIVYSVQTEAMVTISVFDNFGRRVSDILNSKQVAGDHMLTWDLNTNKHKLTTGIYIIRLKVNNMTVNKKLIVQ